MNSREVCFREEKGDHRASQEGEGFEIQEEEAVK